MSKINARLIRFVIFGSLALVCAGLYVLTLSPASPPTQQTKQSYTNGVAGISLGGPFELTDHNNTIFTHHDLENTYHLIYFGFTYCPAICPTELQKITAALNELGEQAKDILPIFISIDPERDTVKKMKDYVDFFHPSLIGLTGTKDQIEKVKKLYKVYAAKAQDENATDYTMDHSSYIYFIGHDGQLIKIFSIDDSASYMQQVFKQALSKNHE